MGGCTRRNQAFCEPGPNVVVGGALASSFVLSSSRLCTLNSDSVHAHSSVAALVRVTRCASALLAAPVWSVLSVASNRSKFAWGRRAPRIAGDGRDGGLCHGVFDGRRGPVLVLRRCLRSHCFLRARYFASELAVLVASSDTRAVYWLDCFRRSSCWSSTGRLQIIFRCWFGLPEHSGWQPGRLRARHGRAVRLAFERVRGRCIFLRRS